MPVVRLTQGPPIHVSRGVGRALDAASIETATHVAEVLDSDRRPALLLIADDELVLARRDGVSRWRPSDIARVEGERILTLGETQVPIVSWSYPHEGAALRARLRELLGQPEPQPSASPSPDRGATEPPPRRSTGQVVAIAVGCVLLAPLILLVALKASGWEYRYADDTSAHWTEIGIFKQTLGAMPAGSRLYWFGPSSGGYRLKSVGLEFAGDPEMHGAEILYRGEHDVVYVNTYVGSQRPEPGYDLVDATHRRTLARVVTPTNQVVLVTCSLGYPCASAADVTRLVRALRPVTAAEIDELPEQFSAIPGS